MRCNCPAYYCTCEAQPLQTQSTSSNLSRAIVAFAECQGLTLKETAECIMEVYGDTDAAKELRDAAARKAG